VLKYKGNIGCCAMASIQYWDIDFADVGSTENTRMFDQQAN